MESQFRITPGVNIPQNMRPIENYIIPWLKADPYKTLAHPLHRVNNSPTKMNHSSTLKCRLCFWVGKLRIMAQILRMHPLRMGGVGGDPFRNSKETLRDRQKISCGLFEWFCV
jgi:hypothetical protein